MKQQTKSQTANTNTRFNANKKRAENKDNLDSREGEEQQYKGEDITHNKKDVKSRKPGTRKSK